MIVTGSGVLRWSNFKKKGLQTVTMVKKLLLQTVFLVKNLALQGVCRLRFWDRIVDLMASQGVNSLLASFSDFLAVATPHGGGKTGRDCEF